MVKTPKLTRMQEEDVYRLRQKKHTLKEIAEMFNITQPTVGNICRRVAQRGMGPDEIQDVLTLQDIHDIIEHTKILMKKATKMADMKAGATVLDQMLQLKKQYEKTDKKKTATGLSLDQL